MIAISLILIAGSAIGIKLHTAIEKRRFGSSLERFRSRLIDCRQLALNMQSDWKGVLQKTSDEWAFFGYTLDEVRFKNFPPLKLGSFSLFFNQKKVEKIEFLFSSTGQVVVEKSSFGTLLFSTKSSCIIWELPQIFQLDENLDGKRLGPVRPDELY